MTILRIPPLADNEGTVASTVTVRLVDSAGRPLIGLRTTDGVPCTTCISQYLDVGDEPWELELTPQTEIATSDGEPTFYAVSMRASDRALTWLLQLADSATAIDLIDAIGATAIDPADVLSGIVALAPARKTLAEWAAAPVLLAAGQMGIDTTRGVMRVGDGETPWSELPDYAGFGAYAAQGHTHAEISNEVGAAVQALATHEAAYIHELVHTERVYVPLTRVGEPLTDEQVILFPWPASGYVRGIKAMARTAPTGSAAEFTLKAAATWSGSLVAVADPVSIAAAAYTGEQATIDTPEVYVDGVGAVEIAADSSGTAADVCLLIDLEHASIQAPIEEPTGALRTVAWNFPAHEESTIDRFEILRDGTVEILETADVTQRSATIWMDYDAEYAIQACLDTECSALSSLMVIFEPGLARGKTTSASSEQTYLGTTYVASNATDGRTSTSWYSDYEAADPDDEWLKVDLGTIQNIGGYRLFFAAAPARDWIVAVSDDDSDWTTVATVTDSTDAVIVDDSIDTSGRYVRVTFSDRQDGWAYGYVVAEFEVLAP